MITKELPKLLEPQRCPLCGNEQDIIINGFINHDNRSLEIVQDKGYSFCNCRNIFYTNWANMKPAVYDKEYYEKYNNSVTGNCNKAFLEAYLPIFQKHILNGEILEIGCIHPGILNGFKEAGYKTTGIDIFSHELAGHTLLTGDFEKIEFNKRYDIIIASHIFEHFHDPVGAIQKCYNLLNNGGLLFIAMPDPYIIDWSSPYSWGHWHLQEHHIMWNMESFCSELEKDGFKMIMKKRNFGDTFICMGDTHLIAEKEGNLE